MSRHRTWGAVVIAVLGFVWPLVATAAGTPTTLTMGQPTALRAREDQKESVVVLSATLSTRDARPVSGQRVEFLMATDILGQKQASIGTAESDSGGEARVTFVVSRTGAYEFAARFAGNQAFERSDALPVKAELTAAPTEAHRPLRLNLIGRWVPWAGLGLGAGVWLVLVFVMVRVMVIIPRSGAGGAN